MMLASLRNRSGDTEIDGTHPSDEICKRWIRVSKEMEKVDNAKKLIEIQIEAISYFNI